MMRLLKIIGSVVLLAVIAIAIKLFVLVPYESRQYAYPTLHWLDGSYPHEDQVILYQP